MIPAEVPRTNMNEVESLFISPRQKTLPQDTDLVSPVAIATQTYGVVNTHRIQFG